MSLFEHQRALLSPNGMRSNRTVLELESGTIWVELVRIVDVTNMDVRGTGKYLGYILGEF